MTTGTTAGDGMIGLDEVVGFVLRHLRTLVLAGAVAGLGAGLVSFLRAPAFTSRALIVPDTRNASASRLAGLAAQFGVAVPGQGGSISPALFVELIRSPGLLRALTAATYSAIGDTTLADHLAVSGRTPMERAERAVRELREELSVGADPETGAIELAFRASSPDLAEQLVSRTLTVLDSFTVAARSRQARIESAFFNARLAEAADSTRSASARLSGFLSRNRATQGSPELEFQRQQLALNVEAARALHQSLQQSYESARLEAARSVPTFIVLEPPSTPVIRDPRGIALRVIFGGLFGVAVAIGYLLARGWWAGYRAQHPEATLDLRVLLRRQG